MGDVVSVAVSSWCSCGVHVADPVRRPGAASLTRTSAEAAGGVKWSPSGPSAASCEAVHLTPSDVRSYREQHQIQEETLGSLQVGGLYCDVDRADVHDEEVRVAVTAREEH